jgi:hypothetical protein
MIPGRKNRLTNSTATVIGLAVGLILRSFGPAFAQPLPKSASQEFNTVLMLSTFQIVGSSFPLPHLCGLTGYSTGTGFVVSQPFVGPRQSERNFVGSDGKVQRLVLVTAAHVLDGIGGDTAFLQARIKEGAEWKQLDLKLPIRNGGKSLYVKHPNKDVAVLDLLAVLNFSDLNFFKSNLVAIPMSYLAEEKFFDDNELHPGDDLSCLGFPLSTHTTINSGAFPVLRGGKIASYPILPQFLFDFEVFPGNSGGPVYISPQTRATSHGLDLGGSYRIVGLLSAELKNGQPLKMGVVVPSPFILETIQRLPM